MARRHWQHAGFAAVSIALLLGLVACITFFTVVFGATEVRLNRRWTPISVVVGIVVLVALVVHVRRWRRAAPDTAAWRPVRFLFELCVLGWVAVVLGASEEIDPARFALACGLIAGVFAFGLLLAPLLRAQPVQKTLRIGDLVLMQLCLIAVGLELGARLLGAVYPTPILAAGHIDVVNNIESHRYRPGQVRYGYPCNSTGHYDSEFAPKQEGQRLILSIGDSFSPGIVPHYYHFTTVLERELADDRVDVYNMGISGTDPPAYLRLWRTEGRDLRPDLLMINLFIGNDIFGSRMPGLKHPTLSSWFDRSRVALFYVPQRLARIVRENRRLAAQGTTAGELQGENTEPILGDDPRKLLPAFPWIADPMLERASFSSETYVQIEAARAFNLLLDQRHDYYAALFELLRRFETELAGTPWLIVLIPDEFQVNDDLWRQVVHFMDDNTSMDRDLPQKRVVSWLRENEISHLDLLPILRGAPALADGRRHLYHLRDSHFNARGNKFTGQAMAAHIRMHFSRALRLKN